MMNRIRSLGAAVVALAAPVLLAAPAAADPARGAFAKVETRISDDTRLTLAIGADSHDDHRRGGVYRDGDYRDDGYRRLNQWGQTEREARDLRRHAVRACRDAVRYEAYDLGYRDIDFEDEPRARQIGRRGFIVNFDEVEFEGYRGDRETHITCEVRRGEVVAIEGIPRPHRGRGYDRRW